MRLLLAFCMVEMGESRSPRHLFLSPGLMGFEELCELGFAEFLSIDVQLSQPSFIL